MEFVLSIYLMSIVELELTIPPRALPDGVAEFLREADDRIEEFVVHVNGIIRGFVPCDYVAVYHAMRAIMDQKLICGERFCEWGSGCGVVACLASMLGYNSYGIEIDADLCAASADLADDYNVAAEFIHGSFVPPGAEDLIDWAFTENDGELSLEPHSDTAYEDLGFDVSDFDLVFSYPWPNDAELTGNMFDNYASLGALLLTYNDLESVRLFRKVK